MPALPASLGLLVVALTVLVVAAWSWLAVAAKVALTRGWLPEPLAEPLARFLRSLGLAERLPLVAWSPRRPVPWAFFDLIAVVALWFVVSFAASVVLEQLGWIVRGGDLEKLTRPQREALFLANGLASLAILALALPLVALRTGTGTADLGWNLREIGRDLRLGLVGFILLAPPVYALQWLLTTIWMPSEHPLIETFKASPDPRFFLVLVFSAAVVAPLFEELTFRVLLQGFLEKALSFSGPLHELFFGAPRRAVAPIHHDQPDADADAATLPVSSAEAARQQPELRGPAARVPIALSSLIFALLHFAHGPDWIPLFVLSVGLGYLYQRTHRLLPSLVVHALLNSLSLWGLWVQVYEMPSLAK